MRYRILKPCSVLATTLAAGPLSAQSPTATPPWDVILNLENTRCLPDLTLAAVKNLAAQMLAPACIRLIWNSRIPEHMHPAGCGAISPSITVVFASGQVSALRLLDAVGFSNVSDTTGARVTIVYDRLPQQMRILPHRSAPVLAHALVHEIAHVLQLANLHASSGIMKARWTIADYAEMEYHPMSFEAEDLKRIDAGRVSWTRRCGVQSPGP